MALVTGTLNFVGSNVMPPCTDLRRSESFVPEAIIVDTTPRSAREDEAKEIKAFAIKSDINSLVEVEKIQEKFAMYKGKIPPLKLFALGVLAGWWVGLATLLAVTIAGGIPADVRQSWPMLPKLVTGFLFPVAIFFIVLFGGELFTGNAMVMCIGLLSRRITISELLYNWFFVLISNFVGCVATVYIFGYLTHLFDDDPWRTYIQGVAETKIKLAPEVAFLRAITANALVCVCVSFGLSARDMCGKLASMWFPIMTFAATGFEHAIANMAYIPLGLMYGAQSDYRVWLYQNFILAILGNIVGGGFIIGGSQYFLFDWTKAANSAPNPLASSTLNAATVAQTKATRMEDDSMGKPAAASRSSAASFRRRVVVSVDEERLRQVFHSFDGDNDGALNGAELMCALHVLGFPCSKSIADGLLASDGEHPQRGVVQWDGYNAVVRRMQDLYELGMDDYSTSPV